MNDYFCDGHFISAVSPAEASRECVRLYDHTPEEVRPWTAADNDEEEV